MAPKRKSKNAHKHGKKFVHDGTASVFTCPDCSGTLFLVKHGRLVQFRCRIGHLYSPEAMLEAQKENVERSLWTAVRALEEQAEYMQQTADRFGDLHDGSPSQYHERSRSALEASKFIRNMIERNALVG